MLRPTVLSSLLLPVALAACNNARPAPVTPVTPATPRVDAPVTAPAVTPTARFAADVVARIPHAPDAFTQGLEFYEGSLFESTGLYGRSTVRVLDPVTGSESRRRDVAPEHFAEGLTVFGRRIYQLTYETHRCFVYDAATLAPVAEHTYTGEGWGLTHDDRSLIMSDGTDTLRFIDPATFAVVRRVRVTDGGSPVTQINELEMVEGQVFANIWHGERIARIDPATGRVVGWIELPFSRDSLGLREPEAVLNGIAYEPSTRRLLVTGKLWPVIFEVRLRPVSDGG